MNIFLGKINQFVLKIGDIPEEEEVSYETVVPTFVRWSHFLITSL